MIDPPAADVERHRRRRGRVHAFERLEPGRTALVVVDLVPFFTTEPGFDGHVLERVNDLAAALRATGGIVAWVVPAVTAPSRRDRELFGDDVAERYARSGGDGPVAACLAPELRAHSADVFAEKRSPGAFFPGRCDLHDRLADCGVDTVLVAGTVANVCCESTVREAFTLGYRVVLVGDAIGAVDGESLAATVRTVYRSFGDVRSTADCVRLLTR